MSTQTRTPVSPPAKGSDTGRRWTLVAIGGLVAGAGVLAARRLRRSAGDPGDAETLDRWLAVTIQRTPEQVMPDGIVPTTLRDLGDLVEVEARPAPQDRGTELRARVRRPQPAPAGSVLERLGGTDPRQAVRAALRRDKQLLEIGEVLRLEPISHGDRGHGPGGRLVGAVAKRADREGLL